MTDCEIILEFWRLSQLGEELMSNGDVQTAVECFEKALGLAPEEAMKGAANPTTECRAATRNCVYCENHSAHQYCRVVANLGIAYRAQCRVEKAADQLEQAVRLCERCTAYQVECFCLNHLSQLHREMGNEREAKENADRAFRLFSVSEGLGVDGFRLTGLSLVGRNYHAIDELVMATGCFEQVLALSRQQCDEKAEAICLLDLGDVHFDNGQEIRALECYEQGLSLARKHNDRQQEATFLGKRGLVLRHLRKAPQACDHYTEAIDICRAEGDEGGEGIWLANLGIARADCGDIGLAIELWTQSLTKMQRSSDCYNTTSRILQWVSLRHSMETTAWPPPRGLFLHLIGG